MLLPCYASVTQAHRTAFVLTFLRARALALTLNPSCLAFNKQTRVNLTASASVIATCATPTATFAPLSPWIQFLLLFPYLSVVSVLVFGVLEVVSVAFELPFCPIVLGVSKWSSIHERSISPTWPPHLFVALLHSGNEGNQIWEPPRLPRFYKYGLHKYRWESTTLSVWQSTNLLYLAQPSIFFFIWSWQCSSSMWTLWFTSVSGDFPFVSFVLSIRRASLVMLYILEEISAEYLLRSSFDHAVSRLSSASLASKSRILRVGAIVTLKLQYTTAIWNLWVSGKHAVYAFHSYIFFLHYWSFSLTNS